MLPESGDDERSLYSRPQVVARGEAQKGAEAIRRGSDPHVEDKVMCRDYASAYSPRQVKFSL
jgi:hypothetical protein